MLNIIFITFIDLLNSLTHRSHHMIDFLKNRYESTIVFCRYDSKDVYIRNYEKLKIIGIPVEFYNLFKPLTLYESLTKIDGRHYDICIAQGPWAGLCGIEMYKSKFVNFLVYEDIDYFPGAFIQPDIYTKVKLIEEECIRNSDITFSVSHSLKDLREKQTGIKTYFLPNGIKKGIFTREKNNHKGINLIYSGSLEEWSGLEIPIKALPGLKRELGIVNLIIVGKGMYEKNYKDLVSVLDLTESVKFVGKVQYKDLPYYYKNADMGLCTFMPTEFVRYSFPIKLVEYMAAGIPSISTDIGELKNIVHKHKCGMNIYYNIADFQDKILYLYNNKMKFDEMGLNGYNSSKQYYWDDIFNEEFKIIYNKLYNKNN